MKLLQSRIVVFWVFGLVRVQISGIQISEDVLHHIQVLMGQL